MGSRPTTQHRRKPQTSLTKALTAAKGTGSAYIVGFHSDYRRLDPSQHFSRSQSVKSSGPPKKSPLRFFLLVFALAIPIWVVSAFLNVIGSLKAPVTDLVLAFIPLAAAVILVYREEGFPGVRSLLSRVFDYKRITHKLWYVPILFLAPLIYLLTSVLMRLSRHSAPVPSHLLRLPVLLAIFFLLAVGEEGGWMGYAIDPMQDRWGALTASVILAIPWWLGHLPSIIEIGGTPADVAWWFPSAIALRILIVWLYNNTGKSLFAALRVAPPGLEPGLS
jgi:uncharacterized protein